MRLEDGYVVELVRPDALSLLYVGSVSRRNIERGGLKGVDC